MFFFGGSTVPSPIFLWGTRHIIGRYCCILERGHFRRSQKYSYTGSYGERLHCNLPTRVINCHTSCLLLLHQPVLKILTMVEPLMLPPLFPQWNHI